MFVEVLKEDAVKYYMAGKMVFVNKGQFMDNLETYSLGAVKNSDELRFVADLPKEELVPAQVTAEKSKEPVQESKKKVASPVENEGGTEVVKKTTKKKGEKTLGEAIAELKDQGLSSKEIAERLNIKVSSVSQLWYLHRKKMERKAKETATNKENKSDFEWDEQEEENKGPRLPQKTVKLENCVSGGEKLVDLAKATALLEAGWSVDGVADEFNVYPVDLEKALKEYRGEAS